MNFWLVTRIVGKILIFESVGMIIPIGISLSYGQNDWVAFLLSACICLTLGFLLSRAPVKSYSTGIHEGFSVVTLGWIAISIFGALPFYISGAIPSYVDSLFETISGFTTTGASLLTEIESLPYGILFWRSFTHWIGGMGILVFTVAILPAMGAGSFQILKAESPGPLSEKVAPRVKDTAKIFYSLYIGMTFLEIIFLLFGGMNLFDSITHTFATVGTGGFSTKNTSVAYFQSPYIQWVITIFMLMAASNFTLYFFALKGKLRDVLKDEELRTYLVIVAVSTIVILIDLTQNHVFGGFFETLRHSAFQVASIITTTGFATANFDTWPELSKAVLFLLLFIGGCAGSTSGGIKNIRILIVLKCIMRDFMKVVHPHAVRTIKINKRAIPRDTVNMVNSFVLLYLGIFVVGFLVLSANGYDFVTSASTVASCLGNVGPGFGLTGPICNYSFFNDGITLFLSFLMLVGRLELFTVLCLFFPSFWKD